ncbi:MAG TPA: hypothetical protein DD662_01935, partial [Planctomycetaceae bacterium]|nr:hypothetical protein [Planctomycetaceae bacterium]
LTGATAYAGTAFLKQPQPEKSPERQHCARTRLWSPINIPVKKNTIIKTRGKRITLSLKSGVTGWANNPLILTTLLP